MDSSKPNPFEHAWSKSKMEFEMLALVAQLRWKHALVDCHVLGLDYTEIHFWRNPETDEFVLTYWEIK